MKIDNPKTGSMPRVARRVSIAQRLAALETQKQTATPDTTKPGAAETTSRIQTSDNDLNLANSQQNNEEPLTSTILHSSLFGGEFYTEPVMTVTQAGKLQATDVVAAAEIFQVRWEDAVYLNAEKAQQAHLLLLSEDVDPRELEALAVSIWATAHWAGPGQLFLFEGGSLKGPFKFTNSDMTALGIPQDLPQAWIIDVKPERTANNSQFIGSANTWGDYFTNEHPAGDELGLLNAVRRMSRRLAGAIRIATPKQNHNAVRLVEPDPESAVNLRVYSHKWLEINDLTYLLEEFLPDIHSIGKATDSIAAADTNSRKNIDYAREISTAIMKRLEIVKTQSLKTLTNTEKTESYGVLASIGNRSRVHISAQITDFLPMAIRHQPWPDGHSIEYAIQWIPSGQTKHGYNITEISEELNRSTRLERKRVRDEIEKIAYLIAKTVNGQILDEDGFLVAE